MYVRRLISNIDYDHEADSGQDGFAIALIVLLYWRTFTSFLSMSLVFRGVYTVGGREQGDGLGGFPLLGLIKA